MFLHFVHWSGSSLNKCCNVIDCEKKSWFWSIHATGMVHQKKTIGTGSLISVLVNRVHPSQYIREKHHNIRNGIYIINCHLLWCELKKISRKDQGAIVFTHSDHKEKNGIAIMRFKYLSESTVQMRWNLRSYSFLN